MSAANSRAKWQLSKIAPKLLNLTLKYAVAYFTRGSAKAELKDYAGAIQDYTQAIELDPKDAVAYFWRGYAKNGLGDYAGAIEDCTKAIELDPKFAGAYFNRGTVKNELRGLCGGYTGLHQSY